MTSIMRSLFPSKRRKTETIFDAVPSSSLASSSSSISLSSLVQSVPITNGHRRQHSTGSYRNGLPPVGPRNSTTATTNGPKRRESNNNSQQQNQHNTIPLNNLCTQSNTMITPSDLRMVLIEAESRVLYDTLTVIPVKDGLVSNVKNMSVCKEFQFLRRRRDTKVISQMLFGAVPTNSGTEAFKIHILEEDDKIMVSRCFSIPRANREPSSDSDSQSTIKSVDAWRKQKNNMQSTTSTPETFNRVRHASLTHSDEDRIEASSASSSFTSTRAFSPPHKLSKNRRRQMAVKTSLSGNNAYANPSSLKSRSRQCSISSQTTDDGQKDEVRQVALGLLFPATKRYFLFQHMPLIEAEVSRFETRIITSAGHPPTFLHNLAMAWDELAETICSLHNAPRLRSPVWLTIHERAADEKRIGAQFCNQLAYLIRKYDNKESGFFISRMITGVLMHHMSWVASVAAPPLRKDERLRKLLEKNYLFGMLPNEDAHSIGYNAQMAQYLELNGNCGLHRSAKTVICGEDADLLAVVCQVLSFFVRCSAVQHIDDEKCWELPLEQAFSPILTTDTPDSVLSPPSSIQLAFSPDTEAFSDDETGFEKRRHSKSRRARANNNSINGLATFVTSPSSSVDSLPSVVAHTSICVVETETEAETTTSITIIDRVEYPCCGGAGGNSTDDEDAESTTELWSPRPSSDGLGRSLFAGPTNSYSPHFVVSALVKQQTNMVDVHAKMFDEVRCTDSPCHRAVHSAVLSAAASVNRKEEVPVQLPESVIIYADISDYSVRIVTSEGYDDVTSPSEAVMSMLEQFIDLHSATPVSSDFLISVIEDSLAHIVGKSLTLVEMVANEGSVASNEKSSLTPDRVRSIVGCEYSDLRLIVNVAAVYWPPVLASVFG